MERVVDRSELLSQPSTAPSSPDIENIKLNDFEFIRRDDGPAAQEDSEQDAADEMDFVLFAPAAKHDADTTLVAKIRVQTPPMTDGEPGFLTARSESYYFSKHLTGECKENIESVAVSGEQILERSQSAWPGSTYDWKVLHVPFTKRQRLLLSDPTNAFSKLIGDGLESRRKRPGKKARLKVRAKLEVTRANKEASQKAAEEKEASEQEKRTRRNREKKVKKKKREKAKKAADALATEDASEESSAS